MRRPGSNRSVRPGRYQPIEPVGTIYDMPVAKGSTIDPARTRAAIVQAAGPLLYERGIDGVGVAELCARLGVSKETLYRHFGTKDGLVLAVLEARSERIHGWIAAAVAAAGDDPADQLAAVFDTLGRWYREPGFRGCAMVNAAAQHHDDPVLAITGRHMDRYLDLLTGIAARAGVADPEGLGRRLLMLVEGATVVAALHDVADAAAQAREAALALLAAGRDVRSAVSGVEQGAFAAEPLSSSPLSPGASGGW
jgi:AcrR family transcriptional regulator